MLCALVIDGNKIGEIHAIFKAVDMSLYIGEMGEEPLIRQQVQVIKLSNARMQAHVACDKIGLIGRPRKITLVGRGWEWSGEVQVLPDQRTLLLCASKPTDLVL